MGRELCDRAGRMVEAALAVEIYFRQSGPAAGTAFDERIFDSHGAFRAGALLGAALLFKRDPALRRRDHSTSWDTIPPTENATTHVPIHMTSPSFHPRSFIITMSEAMQGTKRVMTMRATAICIGLRLMW